MSTGSLDFSRYKHDGDAIRIGIIGYGIRGTQLLKGTGFAQPEAIQQWKGDAAKDSRNKGYEDFLRQDDLNVKITGVCDLFDVNEVREVPDVWNTVLEYPHLDFSIVYSASLANNRDRAIFRQQIGSSPSGKTSSPVVT